MQHFASCCVCMNFNLCFHWFRLWFTIRTKNGTELSNVPHLKDEHGSRYEIKDNSLIIKRLLFEDDGKYICSNPDTKESAEINVVGKRDKHFIDTHLMITIFFVNFISDTKSHSPKFAFIYYICYFCLNSIFSQCLHQKIARELVGRGRWKAANPLQCIGHWSCGHMARWYVQQFNKRHTLRTCFGCFFNLLFLVFLLSVRRTLLLYFDWVAIEEEQDKLEESDETVRGFDGKLYVSLNDSRASLQDFENVKNGTLILNATVLSDRGRYNCTATNMATDSGNPKYKPIERGCYVRVKGTAFNFVCAGRSDAAY